MSGQAVHALIPAAGHSVRFGGTTLKLSVCPSFITVLLP